MRMYVLGAGFSMAAGMPSSAELTQLLIDSMSKEGSDDEMRDTCKLAQEHLNWQYRREHCTVGVEEFFEYMVLLKEWRTLLGQSDSRGHRRWFKMRAKQIESLVSWLGPKEGNLHEALGSRERVANLAPIRRFTTELTPSDVVITFNYDTLLERALGFGKYSLGFPNEPTERGVFPRILKLHGSLSWMGIEGSSAEIPAGSTLLLEKRVGSKKRVRLVERLDLSWMDKDLHHSGQRREFAVTNIGARKELSKIFGLEQAWRSACDALGEAQTIVAIGFSMSDYDVFSRYAFSQVMKNREEAKRPPKKVVVIDRCSGKPLAALKVRYGRVFPRAQFYTQGHENFEWSQLRK